MVVMRVHHCDAPACLLPSMAYGMHVSTPSLKYHFSDAVLNSRLEWQMVPRAAQRFLLCAGYLVDSVS